MTPVAGDGTTRYGDHRSLIEISPPTLLRSFGDRGDHAFHILEDLTLQSSKPDWSSSLVGHVSVGTASILPAGMGSTCPDMVSTDKPVSAETDASTSYTAVNSRSEYESGDASRTLSNVTSLSRLTQNIVPASVSSTAKHVNWETLFMPYRRNDNTTQTQQSLPVDIVKDHTPMNLSTLHEDLSETSVTRHYSENDVIRPDYMDITSMDNTSLCVMPSCFS